MRQSTSLLLALVAFVRAAEEILPRKPNPIFDGVPYLMGSSFGGEGFYLGCGDDFECSILSIESAQVHDGWFPRDNGDGTWRFGTRNDTRFLDVHSNGINIFSNPTSSSDLGGQQWALFSFSDGTYQINNPFWKSNLDVKGSVTPFANNFTGDNSELFGQHWFFQTIAPQTTITKTTTTTYVMDAKTTSIAHVTITYCAPKEKRDAGPTPLLKKRGSEILETTTNTEFFTKTITQTNIDGVQVSTSTDTVFFCEPTSTQVTTSTTGSSSGGTSVPAQGVTTTSAPTSTTTPSAAVHSFQMALGWISMFWVFAGVWAVF